jgi:hypothetical protein
VRTDSACAEAGLPIQAAAIAAAEDVGIRTVIDYSDRQIGSGAGADLFTVRSLERGR